MKRLTAKQKFICDLKAQIEEVKSLLVLPKNYDKFPEDAKFLVELEHELLRERYTYLSTRLHYEQLDFNSLESIKYWRKHYARTEQSNS